jgi:hypothetical protein
MGFFFYCKCEQDNTIKRDSGCQSNNPRDSLPSRMRPSVHQLRDVPGPPGLHRRDDIREGGAYLVCSYTRPATRFWEGWGV